MSDVTKDNPFFIDNKKKLDDIGSGMCLAKWTQVTLQLQTGHNHSCHHPRTHKINVNEIKRNPSGYTILNIKNFVEEKCLQVKTRRV